MGGRLSARCCSLISVSLEAVATQKKKAVAKRKPRRRLIAKILLVLGCLVLIAFIGALFFLEKEMRRVGIFGGEATIGRSVVEPRPTPASPKAGTPQGNQPAPATNEEISREDKKQLDDILRGHSGKPQ
jgi:hypothetical protein